MPIRINLLAEQITAEQERRRDPVKRALFLSCVAILLVGCWIAWGQARVANVVNQRDQVRNKLANVDKGSGLVKTNLQLLRESEERLAALNQLATNRYLWGNTLDALQMLPANPNLRLVRIDARQDYLVTNLVVGRPAAGSTKVPRLPVAVESISLRITGQDLGRAEDGNIPGFQRMLVESPFFSAYLATNGVSMVEWSQPTPRLDDPQRTFVQFTLECRYADKERRK